jgi:hypothetical protein
MLRILLLLLFTILLGNAFELPRASTQCLVGVAKDWNSSHVTVQV